MFPVSSTHTVHTHAHAHAHAHTQFLGTSPTLGLLIGINQHTDNAPLVITGSCACAHSGNQIPKLTALELPTPDWSATKGWVDRHFPAGCDVCGVCVRCSSDSVESLMKLLWEKANLQVS